MGPSKENMSRTAYSAPSARAGIVRHRSKQEGEHVSAGVERGATAVADVLDTVEARTLLEAAQAAGSVTQDEIALALDELDLDAGQIDDFYRTLEEMQIEVVVVEEEVEGAPVAQAEAREGSTDFLQLFLKDIGRVDLLTAAQEVELAKRIE